MRRAGPMFMCALLGCFGEPTTGDRVASVLEPLEPDDEGDRFLGAIEFRGGQLDARRISPTPLTPTRLGLEAGRVVVEFSTSDLRGASGRLGLLPPRAAARQEVAYDMPGQPDDPRNVWIEIEIQEDGPQRFELPAPGLEWHATWAIVALELDGRPALIGARSEMRSDGSRERGGRAILGMVEVERRPTRVQAPMLEHAPLLDGVLDDATWQRSGARLLASQTGEPSELDAKVGGPTEVWFAWDRKHLYVAGSLPDHDLFVPHAERDDPLYRDEAFEFFIAADNSGKRYLEHQVAANNVQFDARFREYRKADEGWNGGWRSAVALDGDLHTPQPDRGWTVELAFAWTELCEHTKIDCPPKPGALLRVNVFRLDKPDRAGQVGLALSPTLEPDFHAWKNAAELELLGPPEPTP